MDSVTCEGLAQKAVLLSFIDYKTVFLYYVYMLFTAMSTANNSSTSPNNKS